MANNLPDVIPSGSNRNFEIDDLPVIMSSLDLSLSKDELTAASTSSALSLPTDFSTNNSDDDGLSVSSMDKRRSTRFKKTPTNCTLIKINRRTITKPKKHILNSRPATSEEDIRSIYLNNKLTKFRATNLETIFEEPKTVKCKLQLTGTTKKKRSLSFSDGYNINKTTVKARRNRIKRLFGSMHKIKKIPMECFLEHFKSLDDNLFETPSTNPLICNDNISSTRSLNLDNIHNLGPSTSSPTPSTSAKMDI